MNLQRTFAGPTKKAFLFSSRLIHTNPLPIPPDLRVLEAPEDTAKARLWEASFKDISIPRKCVELHFSRSSGPGGQNVNKVNTKVTVRCSLDSSWIPAWARAQLRQSSYYVVSSHSVQISSTITRSQAQNIDDCLAKLHSVILSASAASIKNEPSDDQKKKVQRLQQADRSRRKAEKTYRSQVKRSRTGKDWF